MESRIERLERIVRRWRIASSILGVISVVIVMAAFGPQVGHDRSRFDLYDFAALDLAEALSVPRVVGVSSVSFYQNGDTATNEGLVRVWSDGTTELLLMPPDFRFNYETQQWWPSDNGQMYDARRFWRPFVDEDLSP
jgi:hypothetical protein